MERLDQGKLLTMLQTQALAHDQLLAEGKPLHDDWLRQAWVSSAYLTRAIVHKDHLEMRQTLADIWTALVGEWLANIPENETVESAATLFHASMYDSNYWSPEQDTMLQKHEDVLHLIDAFVNLCSASSFNAKIFERIMQLCGVSWDELYNIYMDMEAPDGKH